MEVNSLTATYYGLYSITFAASILAFLIISMLKLRFLIALSSTAYAVNYDFYPPDEAVVEPVY